MSKKLSAVANETATGTDAVQPETEQGYVMNQSGLSFLVASFQELTYKQAKPLLDFLEKGLTPVTITKNKKED